MQSSRRTIPDISFGTLGPRVLRPPAEVMRKSTLRLVNERFPHAARAVARLCRVDETLRDICADLEACEEAVVRLEAAGVSGDLRKEYAALRLRLERELLRHMEESRVSTEGGKGASRRPRKQGRSSSC